MRIPFALTLCVLCIVTGIALCPQKACAQAAVPGVPEIAGIRTGMTAQQAYEVLKAHAPRARISIGQNIVEGVSAKPVPNLMTVKVDDAVPMEIITVWLTTPPSKQVVWAVGETLTYPPDNKMTKATAVSALHKKFGTEMSSQSGYSYYWPFDLQGGPATAVASGSNCVNVQNLSVSIVEPTEPTFTSVSPLIYSVSPKSPCDSLVDVRVQLNGPANAAEYVTTIALTEVDHSLVRSTKEAYSAYVANAGARQRQEEADKARQQQAPVF